MSWKRRALVILGSTALGALGLILAGQGFAILGGSCSTLCRPEVAGTLGALGGFVGGLSGTARPF